MPSAAMVSFRLGGTDGVSIESAKWSVAFESLGFDVVTIAGEGPVDHLVSGLEMGSKSGPARVELEQALDHVDVVVIENVCSLPLNPNAAGVLSSICRGRPTILHHHDLAWQRPNLGDQPPPTDPAWRHITINEISRRQLHEHGITATTMYNRFDTSAPPGDRDGTRAALGLAPADRLFLQPTRALPRKNVPTAIELSQRLEATYWLLGPAEDGYGPELDALVEEATCPVVRGPVDSRGAADAYAACDVVVFPSSWEGFGNPTIESAVHHRPLVIGSYPVGRELAAFGFQWFSAEDPDALDRWLLQPDADLLAHNWQVADANFALRDLPGCLADVLGTLPVTI